jgi:hypothetical protein
MHFLITIEVLFEQPRLFPQTPVHLTELVATSETLQNVGPKGWHNHITL